MKIEILDDGVYFVPYHVEVVAINAELWADDWVNFDPGQTYLYYDGTKKSLSEVIKDLCFGTKSDTIYLGVPYATYGFVLLGDKPTNIRYSGTGFNYGSCNVISVNEPGNIIILAQND